MAFVQTTIVKEHACALRSSRGTTRSSDAHGCCSTEASGFSFAKWWRSANKNMQCFFKIKRIAVEEMEAASEGHSVENLR
jgi:hypothetical protein